MTPADLLACRVALASVCLLRDSPGAAEEPTQETCLAWWRTTGMQGTRRGLPEEYRPKQRDAYSRAAKVET